MSITYGSARLCRRKNACRLAIRVGFQTVWNLFMTRCVINCHKLCPKPVYTDSFRQFNSLAPGRFERNFRKLIFQLILVIDGWSISCKIVVKWMPMDLTDDKSTLVQIMAWCRQATSHYLSQCWPRSLSPYGVIRPQWVKAIMDMVMTHKYDEITGIMMIIMIIE